MRPCGVKSGRMKNIVIILYLFAAAISTFAQAPAPLTDKDYTRIEANPAKGFTYPYYLYVPPELKTDEARNQVQTFLVLPNNTGKLDDDFAVHEADVKRRMSTSGSIASALKLAILMPVFPRPKSDWQIYTQALDRDSMVTDKKEYRRLDLQMIAMMDDARERLKKDGIKSDKRVLLNGFSAQGMFVNRFTFLHPDRVKAVVVGSPGGWPIAPVEKYRDKPLRYPIGVADIKTVSGKKLDLENLRKVPMFVFIGDKDDNDSVPFGDSYDDVDRELINPLLGATPVSRWEIAKQLYKDAGLNAEFRLYPGVAHTVNPAMRDDVRAFLMKYK
jgi:predicted esterase